VDATDHDEPPDQPQGPKPREKKRLEVSPLLVSLFGRYGERHLARHFNAVRLSKSQRPDLVAASGKPLIIFLNHPSWWDPLICLQLAAHFFPDRRHYGPIDAGMSKYRFFERMGFFGVEPGTARGARRFLTLSQEILGRPDAALWIPAEARFTDPRERPVRVRSGIGHLASRARQVVLLPLALEVPFWEDELPEALARFGEEIPTGDAGMGANDWTLVLEDALESALEALATESISRDPARFDLLLGTAGEEESGITGVWRRLRERLRGD
jgi:1-acyl-sn-glycerol-3-phosphate acyltransferase